MQGPQQRLSAAAIARVEDLERQLAVELGVARQVDGPGAAAAELAQQLVARRLAARQPDQRRGGRYGKATVGRHRGQRRELCGPPQVKPRPARRDRADQRLHRP